MNRRVAKRSGEKPPPRWGWADYVLLLICTAILVLTVIIARQALAAPPAGVDPNGPVARWVSRWANARGEGCCGIDSDCRPTAIRPTQLGAESGYDAWISRETYGDTAPDAWVPVPKVAFSEQGHIPRQRMDIDEGFAMSEPPTASDENPTGTGWACWYEKQVRCASIAGGV